jgi:hypothetical protein
LPNSREAVVFGATHGLLTINHRFVVAHQGSLSIPWPEHSEPELCIEKARFLGKWMAGGGAVTTIFAMWGVRP